MMAGMKTKAAPSPDHKNSREDSAGVNEKELKSENSRDFDSFSDSEIHSNEILTDEGIVSANTRKLQLQGEKIHRIILEAIESNSIIIDLNRMGLKEIPEELLQCHNVQYLYLEGNHLTRLPENFFDCLENLQWLDLRRNYLNALPSTYISRHKCLRNLLLEGNQLKTLPLELGLVKTINGLNIANNPMEFPPKEIIERGTQEILAFFREIIKAKNEGRIPPDGIEPLTKISFPRIEELQFVNQEGNSSSSDEGGTYIGASYNSYKNLYTKSSKGVRHALAKQSSQGSHYSSTEDLIGPVPQSAALHKPPSLQELRQLQSDKMRKAGLMQNKKSKSQKVSTSAKRKKFLRDVNVYPPPPDSSLVEERYAEERRLAKLRELKEKQELILQRRKDADKLKQFREDAKRMQQDKHVEKMRKGGKLDFDEAAEHAPFGINREDLKMLSNDERIAQNIKNKHEKIRQRPMSPRTLQKMEQARAERDRELEKRIKQHTLSMQERRKNPKGTPQEEMVAAMRELEVAEQLQRELDARRRDLEYRFTAFTGEPVVPGHSRNRTALR